MAHSSRYLLNPDTIGSTVGCAKSPCGVLQTDTREGDFAHATALSDAYHPPISAPAAFTSDEVSAPKSAQFTGLDLGGNVAIPCSRAIVR